MRGFMPARPFGARGLKEFLKPGLPSPNKPRTPGARKTYPLVSPRDNTQTECG